MEKKFKDYYISGLKNSYNALYRRKTNLFKYYICLFIYILSIPLFILKPVINMAIFKLGEQINENNDIDLTSVVKSSDNPKNYFTVFFAGLIKILIILGIILVLAAIGGLLALIGYAIISFTGKMDYLFILLFASPALLAIVIYLFFIPLIYVETGYIVNSNNDINASNVLNISFNAYKKEGKRMRFGIILVNSLIKLFYLAIVGIGAALLIKMKENNDNIIWFTILIVIVALIPYLIYAPIFTLGTISSLTALNDDVVKDTLTSVVAATNVKFSIPKKDIEDLTVEEKLSYMFDNIDNLKPSIKDLRILDSLCLVGEDENVSDIKETKEVIVPKEEPIKEQEPIIEDTPIEIEKETVEDTPITEETTDVEEINDVIEENIEESKDEILEPAEESMQQVETTEDNSIENDETVEEVKEDINEDIEETDVSQEEIKEEITEDKVEDALNEVIEEDNKEESIEPIEEVKKEEKGVTVVIDEEHYPESKDVFTDEVETSKEDVTEEIEVENIESVEEQEPVEQEIEQTEETSEKEPSEEINSDTAEEKEEIKEETIENEESFDLDDLFKEDDSEQEEDIEAQIDDFLKKGDD